MLFEKTTRRRGGQTFLYVTVRAARTLTGDEVDGLVGGSTVQHGLLALALRLQLAVDLTEQVHQLDARVRLARPCRYSQSS